MRGEEQSADVRYPLVPEGEQVDLAPHVGHLIEVRGRLVVRAAEPDPRTNEGVSTSTPGGSTGMETMPPPRPTEKAEDHVPAAPPAASTVTVTAIRMIAAKCN
ncbi:MAG TPA: hypothetical protein VIL25_01795 [Vicinamibacterales bacterium]